VAEDDDLQGLALLLSAYKADYEFKYLEQKWQLKPMSSDNKVGGIFEELYSLFVDDPYLVGAILGNLR